MVAAEASRVAFSCSCRAFCPSCGARRMVDSAARLVDHVFPRVPVRQWVLSFPWPLRRLFAVRPELLTRVLGVVTRALSNVRPGEISPEKWIRRWTPSQKHAQRAIGALHRLGMKVRDGAA
jgi:hypothetical protein